MSKILNLPKEILWKIKVNLSPMLFFSVIITLALIYTVIFPLFVMLRDTFIVHPMEVFEIGQEAGSYTLYHWTYNFFGDLAFASFYRPFINSLFLSAVLSIIALIVGGVLAYLVVRTDMPYKKFISNTAIIPYIMPSWTLALAWMVFFRNFRVGPPGLFFNLTGYVVSDTIAYGMFPIIICLAMHYYPFGFMLIGGALNRIDSRLEESAEILGASRWQVLRKIVMPLLTPVVFSTILLTFTRGLGTFGAPHFLGGPVNFYVLSTRLQSALLRRQTGTAYIIAFIMILSGVVILYMDQKVIGARKGFVTVAGKGGQMAKRKLGKLKKPVAIMVIMFIFATSIFPLGLLLADSFMLVPGNFTISNMSLEYWIGDGRPERGYRTGEPGILVNPRFRLALINTLRLGFVVAIITGIIGIIVGHTIVRLRGSPFANFLDQLAFLPYMIPSIAFGSIILALFAQRRGPIPSLYGSFWLLVIACVVKYLPYSTRAGIGAMRQIGHELEESAINLGAGWTQRMKRIIFPLQKESFFSGTVLPFISAMRELSLVIILVSPGNQVLTSITVMFQERGWTPYAHGVTAMLVIIIIILVSLSRFLMGTDLAKGLGG